MSLKKVLIGIIFLFTISGCLQSKSEEAKTTQGEDSQSLKVPTTLIWGQGKWGEGDWN